MAILSEEQIQDALTSASGWRRSSTSIVRDVEFADFPQAIGAVTQVAEIAERADHHPDIDIRWRTVTFVLSTHSEGGLTAKDFALAAEINSVIDALTA